ncbi:membrane protein [Gordonia phage LonelyBoi]|nr:membrane protein [Gordonia phage LonelyBoi]
MTVRRVRLRHKLQPDNITARMTVQDITMWLATAAGAYGLSLMEGASIWVGHAYDTARLLPGSPQSWGAILMTVAVLIGVGMFTGKRSILLSGIAGAMLWNLFFALSFLKEYIELRTDGVPGAPLGLGVCITYLGISGVFLLLISTYREKNAAPSNTP